MNRFRIQGGLILSFIISISLTKAWASAAKNSHDQVKHEKPGRQMDQEFQVDCSSAIEASNPIRLTDEAIALIQRKDWTLLAGSGLRGDFNNDGKEDVLLIIRSEETGGKAIVLWGGSQYFDRTEIVRANKATYKEIVELYCDSRLISGVCGKILSLSAGKDGDVLNSSSEGQSETGDLSCIKMTGGGRIWSSRGEGL